MKISIITPSYNQVEYIGRTIQSIVTQKGEFELEYIIIDGGSNDGSVDVIRAAAEKDSRIQWVSEKDSGQSDAINKGLKKVTGDIVAFLNSDDVYKPGALQAVVEYAKANPDANWFTGYCDIIDADDTLMSSFVTSYKNFWLRHFSYNVLMVLNPISQPATFWRKAVLDEIGLINEQEHLVMDYEYWCRIGLKHQLHVLRTYLASFRITPNTKSNTQTGQQFADEARVAKQFGKSVWLDRLHRLHVTVMLLVYKLIRK